jgi:hypothetical protein
VGSILHKVFQSVGGKDFKLLHDTPQNIGTVVVSNPLYYPDFKCAVFTYTLMVAVTFEVVSLHTNTLSESVFPLLKTFLELFFWNALQDGQGMFLNVDNVGPSKRSSVLGIARSRMGPNLANMVDGPISISIFWPKTPGQRAHYEQRHCPNARSKHQAEVQVFFDEQPIFPNNNAGSLFDLSFIFLPG